METCTIPPRETCRICDSKELTFLFSLGSQFVSDFVSKDKISSGVSCPIALIVCNKCSLVQQRYTAPQDFLYTRHYWYVSGTTQTMRNALRDITRAAEEMVELKHGDVVLDIGSNDGTLLRSYTVPGIIKVGVEPAKNLAEKGAVGVDLLINDFWSGGAYDRGLMSWKPRADLTGKVLDSFQPKVITAIGMFYDLEDPNQFIADVAKVLAPNGAFITQLMCLKQTLELGDVGNFAHEHLLFFTLKSMEDLFARHGLRIFHVEENDVNGGSYRLFVAHTYNTERCVRESVWQAKHREEGVRVCEPHLEYLENRFIADPIVFGYFFKGLVKNRSKCLEFIHRERAKGKRFFVYGASTKGNVLLQWYGIDHFYMVVEAAADRSPEKHGLYTVGTGIPIVSEEVFREANPDYAIVLPYTFLQEFVEREKDWIVKGGKFVVPLPEFRVVLS